MRVLIDSLRHLGERYTKWKNDPRRVDPSVRAVAAHEIMLCDTIEYGYITRGGLERAMSVLDGDEPIPGRER